MLQVVPEAPHLTLLPLDDSPGSANVYAMKVNQNIDCAPPKPTNSAPEGVQLDNSENNIMAQEDTTGGKSYSTGCTHCF